MSWEELQAIERDQIDSIRDELAEPPSACPNDGEPLRADPVRGGLRCPFDGWHWPTDDDPTSRFR